MKVKEPQQINAAFAAVYNSGDIEKLMALYEPNAILASHTRATRDPSGKEGDVLTVEFTVLGIPCIGLNGGPVFTHNEAFSFQVAT